LSGDIESRAIVILKELLSDYTVERIDREMSVSGIEVDLLITIRRKNGRETQKLVCEMKAIVEPRHAFELTSRLRYVSSKVNAFPLIFTSKIGKKSMEICRSNEVGYLDLVGNAFIKFNGLLIDRQSGFKNLYASVTIRQKLTRNLFAPLSSRIVRVLITDLEPRKITELASLSGASTIYAFKVVKSLEERGLASRDEQHRIRIDKPGELLDLWANHYDFSKNRVESYYCPEQDPSKVMRLAGRKLTEGYALTMHAGASLIAPYVRFSDVHLYLDPRFQQSAVGGLGLRPTEFGGNVHLIEPFDQSVFYGLQRKDSLLVVSNLQLYLDLYNYPGRGREQAEFLRERTLKY